MSDHPLLDGRLRIPAFITGLIATEMDIGVLKLLIDKLHDFINCAVGQVEGGIKLSRVDIITINDDIFILLAASPRLSMCRSINLDHNSHPPALCIGYYFADLALGIGASYFAVGAEFGD